MKKAAIIFSVLFATVILNFCTTDDFEDQVTKSNKDFNAEVDYSLYARLGYYNSREQIMLLKELKVQILLL